MFNTAYARTIALSLALSYIGFILFTFSLIEGDIADSKFFTVNMTAPAELDVGTASDPRPRLLDMVIKTQAQLNWIATFFFFNAFMSEWNGVVINSIFTKMECGTGAGHTFAGRRKLLFTLFTFYDVWCGVRAFFGILGLMSNYVFMVSTIAGSLAASLLTKLMYLHDAEYDAKHGGGDWAQYIKEVPVGRRPRSKPLGQAPCEPLRLGALVRTRGSDGTGYSRI